MRLSTVHGRKVGVMVVTALMVVLFGAALRADWVDLDAFVTYSIYDSSGSTPLADGSVVYIIGSANNTINPMASRPTGSGQEYFSYSTTGDDVILGVTRIDSSYTGSNGTFAAFLQYDDALVDYVYLRFFDNTNERINGYAYWGNSAIYQLPTVLTQGVATVDFNPNGSLTASTENKFVVIPEPTTANLVMLVVGAAWLMRSRIKRQRRKGPLSQED